MIGNQLIWVILTLCVCVAVLETTAQQFYPLRYGKRDDIGQSRYGRSQGQVEVASRNDRFFLGSRYGKRADQGGRSSRSQTDVTRTDRYFLGSRYGKRSDDTSALISPAEESAIAEGAGPHSKSSGEVMTCTYTGITNLYQCFHKMADENPF